MTAIKSAKRRTKSSPTPPKRQKKVGTFSVVGIGASAGGLEALENFFDHVRPEGNLAFVIIQHLAPKRKSIMSSLLMKHTRMKVLEVADGMKIEPDCVYLNPPSKDVVIVSKTLRLVEPAELHPPRLAIDSFFRSLARDQGEKAICIVLSGTGTDGTLGLTAVKGAGGMTMVQEERQAKYQGMPRSAIGTGLVDYILPVEKMHDKLVKYAGYAYIETTKKVASANQKLGNHLPKIFSMIRAQAGHDFSGYKINTIRRRIERRMVVHQIDKIGEYTRYLQQNTAEIDNLYKDLLITVTNFFRDSTAFEALKKKAIAGTLKDKEAGSTVRIWVPGCATGEEAYSIAILLAEAMEKMKKRLKVQIFATDIDAEAIEKGRLAVFPESIAADVSPERLKNFFTKEDNAYKLKKKLREMVVFSVQNLIKDPPFSRLDLVSCRNVLIYMDAALQQKVLPLFHYTLIERGVLFLGSSETIGQFSDLFSPLNAKFKIFARKGVVADRSNQVHEIEPRNAFVQTRRYKTLRRANIKDVVERLILDQYAPSCILVNADHEILYLHGRNELYLSPPSGEPRFNISRMVRKELAYDLAKALKKAFQLKKAVVTEGLSITDRGVVKSISLEVRPLLEPALQDTAMVVFKQKTLLESLPHNKGKTHSGQKVDSRVAALEQELRSTKEYLQSAIEELEASNEELKSTNEELQSTNEELQSANEELQTSREELHSTNEELETVNAELQHRVEELSDINNDFENLLASSEIATVFLDPSLRIKRFTPSATKIFNLIKSDVGRPISDITSNLLGVEAFEAAAEVLRTLVPEEAEATTKGGNWHNMRILPYRTTENVIDGVVMTFADVTLLKRAELSAENARKYSENIVDAVEESLLVLDSDLRVVSANRAFYRMFKTAPEDSLHKLVYELGNHQWDMPELRQLLEQVIPRNIKLDKFEVTHDFPAIGRKRLLLNATRIEQTGQQPYLILLAIKDVNGAKVKAERSSPNEEEQGQPGPI